MKNVIPAAILAATMTATPAPAAEVEAYAAFLCHSRPYPYGETCTEMVARVDRETCEDDAARLNTRGGPNSPLRAECRSIVVDCSQGVNVICDAAAARRQSDDWDKSVAGRIADGAKTEKKCSNGTCATATISPADQYGVIRQLIETTGATNNRLQCTVELAPYRGTKAWIRYCGTFVPSRYWQAEWFDRDHWSVVKYGTVEEVNQALGW